MASKGHLYTHQALLVSRDCRVPAIATRPVRDLMTLG